MAVSTGRQITRARVIEIPMTDMIIKAVEDMAEEQGIQPLKFHARDGSPVEWMDEMDGDSDDDSNGDDSDDDEDTPPDLMQPNEYDSGNDSDSESDDDDEDDMINWDEIDREEIHELIADRHGWENEAEMEAEAPFETEAPFEIVDEAPAGLPGNDHDANPDTVRRSSR
jgi:hypothetical protein